MSYDTTSRQLNHSPHTNIPFYDSTLFVLSALKIVLLFHMRPTFNLPTSPPEPLYSLPPLIRQPLYFTLWMPLSPFPLSLPLKTFWLYSQNTITFLSPGQILAHQLSGSTGQHVKSVPFAAPVRLPAPGEPLWDTQQETHTPLWVPQSSRGPPGWVWEWNAWCCE